MTSERYKELHRAVAAWVAAAGGGEKDINTERALFDALVDLGHRPPAAQANPRQYDTAKRRADDSRIPSWLAAARRDASPHEDPEGFVKRLLERAAEEGVEL